MKSSLTASWMKKLRSRQTNSCKFPQICVYIINFASKFLKMAISSPDLVTVKEICVCDEKHIFRQAEI